MELRHTDSKYYEERTINRYRGYYKQLERFNRQQAKKYIELSKDIQSLVADFYVRNSNSEGLVDLTALNQPLTPLELANYRTQLNLTTGLTEERHLSTINQLLNENNLTRLDSLMNLIKVRLMFRSEDDFKALSDFLMGIYTENFYKSLYELHKGLGLGFPVARRVEADVLEILLEAWSGLNYQEYIENAHNRLEQEIKKQINLSARDELVLTFLLDLLDKKVDANYKNQKLINESETTRNLNQSKEDSSLESGITSSYVIVATLDNRTTEKCRDMDGKVYNYSEKKIGVNAPPFHFHCRSICSTALTEEELNRAVRIARDPLNNQNYYVSADISYRDWQRLYLT